LKDLITTSVVVWVVQGALRSSGADDIAHAGAGVGVAAKLADAVLFVMPLVAGS
jgi:hypothetical protein